MAGAPPTWATGLMTAFRSGRLSADELWCVVLDCHGLPDPRPVVELVLRSHAALAEAPEAPDLANEAELFVLDEAADELSIPA